MYVKKAVPKGILKHSMCFHYAPNAHSKLTSEFHR